MADLHHDHAPQFERTSLATLDDTRPAPGGQGPFFVNTLVPDQFPAPPANVQLTRTSITGVDDDDTDSAEKPDDDMEKGQVRPAWTPVTLPDLPISHNSWKCRLRLQAHPALQPRRDLGPIHRFCRRYASATCAGANADRG